MINLFESVSPVAVAILKPSLWDLVSGNIQHNVRTVQAWQRHQVKPVKATHPFIRLLSELNLDAQAPLQAYITNIKPTLLRYAAQLGWSTSVSFGHTSAAHFYDHHITELYIGYIGSFDELDAAEHWQDLDSTTVLTHPKSDISIPILDGRDHSSQSGMAVIAVDLLKLAIQYHCYLQMLTVDHNQDATGKQIFLSRYVLPNMIPSHMEIALLNRLFDKSDGSISHYEILNPPPMALVDCEAQLDRVLSRILYNLSKVNGEYHHLLSNIPSLYSPTMHHALILPEMLYTQQVMWSLVLSRLDQFYKLTELRPEDVKISTNKMNLADFKRSLTQYHVPATLESKLYGDQLISTQLKIADLLAMLTE